MSPYTVFSNTYSNTIMKLTVTETITREMTATEKMNLNINDVIENYLQAMNVKDKKGATEYAKIMLMQAMLMKN